MTTGEVVRTLPLAWVDPLAVANGLRAEDGLVVLLSDGGALGRRSYVAAEPSRVDIGDLDHFNRLKAAAGSRVIGLAAYDGGARAATGDRDRVWPDLVLCVYPAVLEFDHTTWTVRAIGAGEDEATAHVAAERASSWLARALAPPDPPPPADSLTAAAPDAAYLAAVRDVVGRIGAGELFQANLARSLTGRLNGDADPFDAFLRLRDRAAAYGAFWRVGDRALVSNSPELFLTYDPDGRTVHSRPIKGTRPRDRKPDADAALAADLAASLKDRAENLMIVDLMRNDLSRVATPGSVRVDALFEIESHPTVHHLVSSVSAEARPGLDAADILDAAFPPGSITGAPKHQAMRVIAGHEPPRGPWCGSLFHIDGDGRLTASVLIRTAWFVKDGERWAVTVSAGAGIVADSDPESELAETNAKLRALREALIGA